MRTITHETTNRPRILIASYNHDQPCTECGQDVRQGERYVLTADGRVHMRCWRGDTALTLTQLLHLLRQVYRRA